MKTLTLIEEPTEEVSKLQLNNNWNLMFHLQVLAEAEDEFERLLNEGN